MFTELLRGIDISLEGRVNLDKILTLIIPAYNAQEYLHKCLDSFLIKEDNLKKLQVVVVNDGSNDDTLAIANEYVSQYPEVFEVIDKENGGHGSTINEGVKKARGKYFKVIDADDWMMKEGLLLFLYYLEKCEADIVVSDYYTYDIRNQKMTEYTAHLGDMDRNFTLSDVMDNWKSVEWGMTFHGMCYNTEFYRKQNYELCEKVFYEDQEYATVPACKATSVRFSEIFVYVYRVGDVTQSVSYTNQVKRINHLETVIEKLLQSGKILSELDDGAKRYWLKKVTMVITSYYQITLLKDSDRKSGRSRALKMSQKIQNTSEFVYNSVQKKAKVFLLLNYFHVTNKMYEELQRKIKRK